MDKQDIQATINYIIALWSPTPKKFGEVHQTLFVDRIRKLNLTHEQARAVIGEVFLTVKSFGGPSLDEIYRRFKAIDESKYRAATVWKVEQKPASGEHKSMREWMEWYTDPAWPGRLGGLSDRDRAYFEDWKRTGKIPPIVKG